MTLIAGGPAQSITITNTSDRATLTDIRANFAGTPLDSQVTESSNSCATLLPENTCTIAFTPGNTSVTATDFIIQGTDTLPVIASIAIQAATATATTTPTSTPTHTATPTPTPTNTATPTPTPTLAPAVLSIGGSPLQLTVNGASGTLTITNTSTTTTALNITSDFTGTALDGNVTETGNTCSSVAPLASCTLTFTPGSSVVAATTFNVHGSNTLTESASIEIEGPTLSAVSASSGAASGGTGVTLTGTLLTGATSVTFGGIAATSVNVINSTTVTAVTPAHSAGAVDVEITTPSGSATLPNGYTFITTTVGQSVAGGTIACLNGGLNNLIAATADNSTSIQWGGLGTSIGAGAQSINDGATNTAAIVTDLGNNGGTPYGAKLCSDYEVDSQGNTPCEAGNTCYNDWFLPAGNNTTASGQLNCLYTNRNSIGGFASGSYTASTESSSTLHWAQLFVNGSQSVSSKGNVLRVRCVRSFTP